MPTINIGSMADWSAVAANVNGYLSGDIIQLTASFIMDTEPTDRLKLGNATLDGNGHTVWMTFTKTPAFEGLFTCTGGTIQNIVFAVALPGEPTLTTLISNKDVTFVGLMQDVSIIFITKVKISIGVIGNTCGTATITRVEIRHQSSTGGMCILDSGVNLSAINTTAESSNGMFKTVNNTLTIIGCLVHVHVYTGHVRMANGIAHLVHNFGGINISKTYVCIRPTHKPSQSPTSSHICCLCAFINPGSLSISLNEVYALIAHGGDFTVAWGPNGRILGFLVYSFAGRSFVTINNLAWHCQTDTSMSTVAFQTLTTSTLNITNSYFKAGEDTKIAYVFDNNQCNLSSVYQMMNTNPATPMAQFLTGSSIGGTINNVVSLTMGDGWDTEDIWQTATSFDPVLKEFTSARTGGALYTGFLPVSSAQMSTDIAMKAPVIGVFQGANTFESAADSTIRITTYADWAALVAASNIQALTAGQTVRLEGDFILGTYPGAIKLGSAKFDGYGHTLLLASNNHVGLFDVQGGIVANIKIDNLFVGGSTAVLCTNGSWGTFRSLRFTGNALRGSVVATGVQDKTTSISNVSFTGVVSELKSGGIFGTTGTTLGTTTYSSGAATAFIIHDCDANATGITTNMSDGSAALGYALAIGDETCTFTSDVKRCCASVASTTGTQAACLFHSVGTSQISECYGNSAAAYTPLIRNITTVADAPAVMRDMYYVTAANSSPLITSVTSATSKATLTNLYYTAATTNNVIGSVNASAQVTLTNTYCSPTVTTPIGSGIVTGTPGSTGSILGSAGLVLNV